MTDYYGMVMEFHKKYGHVIADKPKIPCYEIEELRRKLIAEEIEELAEAMDSQNLVDIADALGDVIVVVIGTAISYGIPLNEVFTEVHRSNMTKSDRKNEYGKTVKGPDFSPANIKDIIYPPEHPLSFLPKFGT